MQDLIRHPVIRAQSLDSRLFRNDVLQIPEFFHMHQILTSKSLKMDKILSFSSSLCQDVQS